MTDEDDEEDLCAKPINVENIVKFRRCSTTETENQILKSIFKPNRREETAWKTSLRRTDKKIIPVKKKLTGQTKNYPVAMNVL